MPAAAPVAAVSFWVVNLAFGQGGRRPLPGRRPYGHESGPAPPTQGEPALFLSSALAVAPPCSTAGRSHISL